VISRSSISSRVGRQPRSSRAECSSPKSRARSAKEVETEHSSSPRKKYLVASVFAASEWSGEERRAEEWSEVSE
jgi:hypothetical protein